jgi:hypothetical protein
MTNEVTIHVKAKDTASKALDTISKTIVRNMTQATIKLAGFAAAAAAAFPAVVQLLTPVVVWTYKLTAAMLQAAPALAAFGVAGVFVKATLGQIFDKENAMVKALTPLGKAFTDAGKAASKMAAEGIRPMVNDLIKSGFMDRVEGSMRKIGVEVNKVAFGMLTWVKTKPGAEAIGRTLTAIDKAVKGISTPITRVAMSFGEMVGRIAGVSLAAGKSGLTGVLNKLADAMDNVTESSVAKGLEDFGHKVDEIKTFILQAVDAVAKAYGWYKKWEKQINLVADALSVLSIALGIMGGGPILVIIGAVSLLVRHFDGLKKVFQQIKDYLSGDNPLTRFGKDVAKYVVPQIKKLWEAIQEDLIPAFLDFADAAKPIIKIMLEKLGPVIGVVFGAIVLIIRGAVHVIATQFRIMAGVLRIAMKAYERLREIVGPALFAMRIAVVKGAAVIVRAFLNMVGIIINGAARAFGWVPGIGPKLRSAAAKFNDFRAKVNRELSKITRNVNINITAHAHLVQSESFSAEKFKPKRRASGGNAATGGVRGNQVLVGEQGPEIVDLPMGSHVNSNADSRRIAGGGKSGGGVHFHFHGPVYGDHNALKRALVNMKRAGDLDLVLR